MLERLALIVTAPSAVVRLKIAHEGLQVPSRAVNTYLERLHPITIASKTTDLQEHHLKLPAARTPQCVVADLEERGLNSGDWGIFTRISPLVIVSHQD
jgi:hypothetical protein